MFLKDNIKSTGKSIEYTHFEMINYLTSNSLLTIQEKKEAFKTRTRMTEVKTNYKNKYVDYNCVACEKNYTFVEATETEKEDNRYEDKIWVICKELDGSGELPKSVKVVTKCDAYECKSCYY